MSSVINDGTKTRTKDEILPISQMIRQREEQNVSSKLNNEQSTSIQASLPCITTENISTNFLDQNGVHNKLNESSLEAKVSCSFQNNTTENCFDDDLKKQQKIPSFIILQNQQQQQPLKDNSQEAEPFFVNIDQQEPILKKKNHLSYRSFIGTMSNIEDIYSRDNFLCGNRLCQRIFIFMDSVFRGVSQVMFASNPLSGIIIMIGLFIGNWELALYGLLATAVSTLTAHVLEFDYNAIRAGLYGFNGCLVGMGIAFFSFPNSPHMIIPIVIMSIFSTIFNMAVGKILVQRLQIPPFTFSFQICTWIWLLGSLKYRYFFVNGTILSPNILSTIANKPLFLNVSFSGYSFHDNVVGFFNSVSQVYFIENPYTGIIILVGLCVCSRILSVFALFGAVTGQLTAAYFLGLPATAIRAGLWGFNSALACQALGGMFFVLYGYRIWLATIYGSIMTVLIQATVSAFLAPIGMPTLTFPFTFVCWIFCLIAGSRGLIGVKLSAVSIPEDHRYRYRLSRFVKRQFKFLNYFTNFLPSPDEDITLEEFTKVETELIPSLICSYAYRNDINQLKMLVLENVNIDSVDHNLRSALHISASEGNMKLCKWLIEDCEANVNLTDNFGGTPLFDAFWHRHLNLLEYLYTHGARMPTCKTKELAFYLNAFVYEGDLKTIRHLVKCGFDPNIGDYKDQNALHIAVITNQFNIVRYLIEEVSARLDIVDYSQRTAIEYASYLPTTVITDYLLDKKDVSIPMKMKAENIMDIETVVIKNPDRKTDEKQDDNRTLSINLQESLLPALFSINKVHDNIKIISDFLEKYPDLNIFEWVDYDFRCIAHIAAAKGQLEHIRFLFEHFGSSYFGSIMSRADRWNLSPIDEAYRHGHVGICNFIKEHILSQNDTMYRETTHLPATNIKNDTTSCLLRKWKKIFHFATLAASGAAERIDGLFRRGYYDRNEIYADYDGRTPMHSAAVNGHMNVVQVLLQYGYDGMTYKDRWGNRPIDEARRNKFFDIADELERPRVS
ncbi:unnamed protein product [Rotaria sp. Silwood2]|nr:unnamed protein product [Rotaria sp. Silwood2]CAF3414657.1 unnamed protein product [Rotaria sp. Silwood2]CAF4278065.1 unnamed protein product [Rotaria sp. Silwood2]